MNQKSTNQNNLKTTKTNANPPENLKTHKTQQTTTHQINDLHNPSPPPIKPIYIAQKPMLTRLSLSSKRNEIGENP